MAGTAKTVSESIGFLLQIDKLAKVMLRSLLKKDEVFIRHTLLCDTLCDTYCVIHCVTQTHTHTFERHGSVTQDVNIVYEKNPMNASNNPYHDF